MGNLKDLTGRRFGRLTVLERAEDVRYKDGGMAVQWKCHCDCGKEVIKKSANLLNGKSKSCGCLRNEIGNNPFRFEVGQKVKTKYGKLLIESFIREERKDLKTKDKKYICRCLVCGEKNIILEHTLVEKRGSCKACSDSRSFGERFFYWFLKQFNIDFDTEYSPGWAGRRKYDYHFVTNGKDYIVEIDGAQHIRRYVYMGINHDEVVKIDKTKEQIAEDNGHIIIRINCEQSKGKYIAQNIINSELKNIFDLEKVNWNKCFYMAMSSKTRAVCDLWNGGHTSTKEIADIMKVSQNHVSKLLIECADFHLCDYDSKEESYKGSLKSTNGKRIICLENGVICESAQEFSRKSDEIFGIHLNGGSITRVCRKERKSYKGFHFEFV